MNKPTEKTITCPKCGAQSLFRAWESVNVTLHRELKHRLLDGSLTRASCEKCGWSAEVVYPLLYHDMERRYLVWLWQAPTEPASAASVLGDRISQYKLRLVKSRRTLIEKVLIFDAALDDRVIEIVKLLLLVKSSQGVHPLTGDLFFASSQTSDAGPMLEFHHLSDGQVESLSVPKSIYDRVIDRLADDLAKPEPGEWLRVDAGHVEELAKKL